MNQRITCPSCKVQISIDDALSTQIENKIRAELTQAAQVKEQELREREQKIVAARENLKTIIQKQVEENLIAERQKLKSEVSDELKLLTEQLAEKDKKLNESRQAELHLRKEKLQLEEEKKAFEVEKQRQLDAERSLIIAEAAKKASDEQQFKVMELSKKLNDALKVNEELSRKLQQGSQQTQGEVLELELEDLLKREFTHDQVTPVSKGVNGADIIQKVLDKYGRQCGTIVWESKHTKNWTESWVPKLKDDQLREKADLAVIVTTALPKNIKNFGPHDGIWVTDFASVVGLAIALRMNLIQLHSVKMSSVGKNEKMEILYSYLTGPEFRQRIEAIVQTFTNLQLDLNQEKRAYARMWEKREKQINRVIENTVGMYGDLEGITGQALPKIDILELPEN